MPSVSQHLEYLKNPNVQAFLSLIGWTEGAGYNTLYGGGTFNSYAAHPNQRITAGGYTSTAAGRYQFLYGTWIGIKNKLGLPDFSPQSQDIAALELIAERGALSAVLAGNLIGALKELGCAWASLPYSGCGQREKSISSVIDKFNSFLGGSTVITASQVPAILNSSLPATATGSGSIVVYAGIGLLLLMLVRR